MANLQNDLETKFGNTVEEIKKIERELGALIVDINHTEGKSEEWIKINQSVSTSIDKIRVSVENLQNKLSNIDTSKLKDISIGNGLQNGDIEKLYTSLSELKESLKVVQDAVVGVNNSGDFTPLAQSVENLTGKLQQVSAKSNVFKQLADDAESAANAIKSVSTGSVSNGSSDYYNDKRKIADEDLIAFEKELDSFSTVSEKAKARFDQLKNSLGNVTGIKGLKKWTTEWNAFKKAYSQETKSSSFLTKAEEEAERLSSALQDLSKQETTNLKVDSYSGVLTEYGNTLAKLEEKLEKIKNSGKIDVISDEDQKEVAELIADVQKLEKALGKDYYNKSSSKGDATAFSSMQEAIDGIIAKGGKVTGVFGETSTGISKVTGEIETDNGQVQKLIYTYDKLGQVIRTSTDTKPVKNLTQSIAGFLAQIGSYYLTTTQIIGYVKEGFKSVQELDAAFIEMQKVSDETTASLREFSDVSFDLAASLGTTAVSLQESTADWMRLGKSLEEAKEMAQDTQILMNVSEFDSITDATDALISMTQAYDDLEAMDIINKVNNVGNNFAISTDEASTALQKSASSLATAGNSIDEALALITTANTVVQDSDSVANALKTVSMRITGTKTSTLAADLEAAGEDTDSLITTVSKLQSTVKQLTTLDDFEGVDILDENGNYKSTYQILQEIADVWDELTAEDKEKGLNRTNALLETLAGKNRANTIAAILQNAELLQSVYESSLTSEGSAEKENAEYMEGYEAKLNQLTTATQEFWYTLINSDDAKEFIELLTRIMESLTKIVDTIGSIPTAAGIITLTATLNRIIKSLASGKTLKESLSWITDIGSKLQSVFTKSTIQSMSTVENELMIIGETSETSAGQVATLSLNLEALAGAAVVAAIIGICALVKAFDDSMEEAREQAQQLGEEFASTKSEISDYKEQIEELKAVIEDESSSLADVGQARVDLMSIQAEMLEKYGSEKEAISAINDIFSDNKEAIEETIDAYERLAKTEWQSTKRETNDVGFLTDVANFFQGYDNQIDRIVDEVENQRFSMGTFANTDEEENRKAVELLQNEYGESAARVAGGYLLIEGSLDEVQERLQTLVNKADELDLSDRFVDIISDELDELGELDEQYQDIYDNYVLYDKILSDNSDYADSYHDIISAYDEYYDAVKSGNSELAEQEKSEYFDLLNGIIDGIDDEAIVDYFRNMYPTLAEEFSKWDFTVDLNADDSELKAKVESYFGSGGSLEGLTSDQLTLQANGTEVLTTETQKQAWKELVDLADTYEMEIEDLISLLEDLGYVSDEATSLLLEKTWMSDDRVKWLKDNGYWEAALTLNPDVYDSWFEYRDAVLEAKAALDAASKSASFDDIFALEDASGAATTLGTLSASIDTIQNAYKALDDAIDEYNKTGAYDIDTIQSIIALGDDFLDYLVDEDGALKLDKESLQQLTLARMADLKAQIQQTVINNVSRIYDEASANEYLKTTNYALADSYDAVTEAMITNALASTGLDEDSTTYAQVETKMRNDLAKIDDLFNKIDISDSSIGSASSSSSSSGSSTKDTEEEYDEFFDFFEHRVDQFTSSLEYLEAELENVNGAFAKNQLLNGKEQLNAELLTEYGDALNMYQAKADELLQRIPESMREAVKNGSVYVGEFVGDEGKEVKEAIEDYKEYADKVWDCKQNIAELKEELRDLELEKFNNIIQDYTDQIGFLSDSVDLIEKQIGLLEESGEVVGEAYYQAQIDQTQDQLNKYLAEKAELESQLESALSSGYLDVGTDEWIEMENAITDVDSAILDCETSIEEFDNAILELHTEMFDRVQDQFDNLNSELEHLEGLIDDDDVANDDGSWSDEGLTKLGLYAQQYELATYQAQTYANEIDELEQAYADGKYSETEYMDRLAELTEGQWDAIEAAEDAKDAIVELNEARIDIAVEAIEDEIDAYQELIDAKKEALEAEQDLHEYRESIAEKNKTITDLEKQIAAMENDTTASTQAKIAQLKEELSEAQAELDEAQYDHSIETQEDALDQSAENFENAKNAEIEELQATLENEELLISESLERVRQNAALIGTEIATMAAEHGVQVSSALTTAWAAGENAIASYGTTLSAGASAFITNIQGVENQVWSLKSDADTTATALAYMFATRADTLVSELTESYMSESNLAAMTNALQNALIDTLTSGYDTSGIVSALNAITDAANAAASAVAGIGSIDTTSLNSGYVILDDEDNALSYAGQVVDDDSSDVGYFATKEEAQAWYNEHFKKYDPYGRYDIEKFANGGRNLKKQVAWTQEHGAESILSPSNNAILTPLSDGDSVLTSAMTKNLWDWATLNPSSVLGNMSSGTAPVAAVNNNNQSINVHYDSLIDLSNSEFNDRDGLLKDMSTVAQSAIKQSYNELNKQLKKNGVA